VNTLNEQYPKEQARCRELLKVYREIPTGAFGAAVIEQALREADEAAISSDLPRMIAAFKAMRGCS